MCPAFCLGGEEVLPVPTVTQLSEFSGRPETSYTVFANTALKQATLLMSLRTCLASMPGEADKATLILYGILELADDIVLKQPHRKTVAKPFSSETIMSYSYSKSAQKAQEGKKTGLMWFDLAVQELSACESGEEVASAGISVFEKEGLSQDSSGNAQVLGPSALRDVSPLWTNPDNYGR